ncbi:MAG: hypothetical protein ACLGIV_06565 [Actinomycetes bacterium]
MGRHGERRSTVRLDVGRLAAVVPVVVLVASGVAAAADRTAPAATLAAVEPRVAEASVGPLDVPERPLEDPASLTASDGTAPALVLPAPSSADGDPGRPRVTIAASGIPDRALAAYRYAERLLDAADPACRLDWSLVAAIGKVESDHGRFGGNALDAAGVARPGIYGIPLDGRPGVAAIPDSDGGRWDRDTRWDRAVGPMQFIPGTWRSVGSDAEPDGVRDPQDVDDAAAAAGVYLCSGPGDLSTAADRYAAVHRYNRSDEYVRTVLAIADAYARGTARVVASALPAARGAAAAPAAPATEPAAPAPKPAATAPPAGDGRTDPEPAPSPRPTAPPSTASDPVRDTVDDVTDAVEDTAPAPAPVPAPSTTTPAVPDPLLVATAPAADQACVDADGEPVDLVLGLCPAGAFLAPRP